MFRFKTEIKFICDGHKNKDKCENKIQSINKYF